MAGVCSSRTRQSPIDLPPAAPTGEPFTYKYPLITDPFEISNNGHAFSADFAGLGYGGLTYQGEWYNLMNINVHSLSEHTWNGQRKPLELHLVHKHYANEKLVVVAIAIDGQMTPPAMLQGNASSSAFRRGDKRGPQFSRPSGSYMEPPASDADFNKALQAFLKVEPPAVNMKVSVPVTSQSAIDLNSLLQTTEFYEYHGSLTAPPCAEIVTWLVRKEPLKASSKQVLYLHDAVYKTTADFGNYRATMPLGERTISLLQGVLEDPPKTPDRQQQVPGNPQQSDREFRAMKWAMDSLVIARQSSNYIKDLDNRMRRSAEAHAEALNSPFVMDPADTEKAGPKQPVESQEIPTRQEINMEAAAQQMAGMLAKVAREEVEDAGKEIQQQSKALAMKAAADAAGIVATGTGDLSSMANSMAVPTGR